MDSNEELIMGARNTPKSAENENLDIVKEISLENFESFILHPDASIMQNIAQACVGSELSSLKIRLNLWRVFLNVIPFADEDLIREKINNNRLYYSMEFENFKPNKNMKDDPLISNPLSRNVNSPWKSFFEDSELRNQIKKDVERTYQDKEIFQTLKIKNILTNVLFVWSKLNPEISYRQGMNEIAAVVTVIFFTESIAPGSNEEKLVNSNTNVSQKTIELFKFLNDETYAEAEIFILFDKIMKVGQQEMFRPNVEDPNKKKQPINPLRPIKSEAHKMSPILARSSTLFEVSLNYLDKELFKHLKYYNVEPHIFLLRWIRCMTTREFHLNDSVNLWDSIFYEYYLEPTDNKFNLLDCVCLSMITYVRAELLNKRDDSACLQRLLKYPPVENVAAILNMAWKYLEQLKTVDEDELNNPKPAILSTDPKTEKKPIFFNSGLVYKPSSNPKIDRKFEEKSENYPTIMENQKSKFDDFEKKSAPMFSHQHERPKSTNTEQKKEVADLIEKSNQKNTNFNEEPSITQKPQKTGPIFNDLDEKEKPHLKSESPKKIIDFNKGKNRETNTNERNPILFQHTSHSNASNIHNNPNSNNNNASKGVNSATLTVNNQNANIINNNNSNNNLKLDSLKERLNFINSQCQNVIQHLDDEQNKVDSQVLREELDQLKTMKKMIEECVGLLNEKKNEERKNEQTPPAEAKNEKKEEKGGFVIKKAVEKDPFAANPLLRKK